MLIDISSYEHIGVIYVANIIILQADEKGEFSPKLRALD